MINERDEMGEEERQAMEAQARQHATAAANATKAASVSRTFIIIGVQPNGDMCHVFDGEAMSDYLAIETVFKQVHAQAMRQFKKQHIDSIL